ncbi:hypothetical protein F5887DRAFT_1163906 [Amanita rubescens]|nr:hypothetical protein F5887DRAFT_1163906 [Amanita rubescens]
MVLRPITRRDSSSGHFYSTLRPQALDNHMVITTDLTPDPSTTHPYPGISTCQTAPSSSDSYDNIYAENTPENIALREPTKETMDFLTPDEAQQRWGSEDESAYRVLSAKGNTRPRPVPPPPLPLRSGSFPRYMGILARSVHAIITFPLLFSFAPKTIPPHHPFTAPSLLSSKEGQYDRPGFNGYFLCATFPIPSLPVESQFSRPRTFYPFRRRLGQVFHYAFGRLCGDSGVRSGCGRQLDG